MSINSVTISGNLTRDAELRMTPSGTEVLTFCIAVNDRRKNAAGEWADFPNYVDVTAFGGKARFLADRIAKGVKVCVAGKLRWSQWEKDGQKRSKLEVIADEVEVMAKAEPMPEPYADSDLPF